MKTLIRSFVVLLLLLCSVAHCPAALADTAQLHHYTNIYEVYFNQAKYDSCLLISDEVLQIDSTDARLLKARVYFAEHRWEEAIAEARMVSSARPMLQDPHAIAFWCATMVRDVDLATRSAKAIAQIDPNNPDNGYLHGRVEEMQCLRDFSYAEVGGLLLLWLLVLYLSWPRGGMSSQVDPARLLPLSLLVAGAVSCTAYILFYAFAPWIRSGNIHYPAQDYNPAVIREFTFDHDGHEGYALYLLFVLVVLTSWLCYLLVMRIRSGWQQWSVIGAAGLLSVGLLLAAGLYIPCAIEPQHWLIALALSVAMGLVCYAISDRAARHPRRTAIGVVLLSAIIFILPLGKISIYDYSYILSPALRLYHGVPLRDVYFQYDFYMSFMALAFLRCGIDLNYFPIMAQAGYFIFLLAIYFFSRKWFRDQRLPLLLFLFELLWRYYANMDPLGQFQITPWRLDLWLVLLILAYRYGVRHWSVAFFLGLIIIFHKNFGLLYLAAYFQILLIWSVLYFWRERRAKSLWQIVADILTTVVPLMLIISCALGVVYVLLGSVMPSSALQYSRIGIGMLPIAPTSIYWYMPVVLSAIVILLYRYRAMLSSRYIMTGLFLVVLTISESMYFFGRSHEHNVINLAGPVSLCIFLVIDIIGVAVRSTASEGLRARRIQSVYRTVPIILVVFVFFTYYDWMANKIRQEINNIRAGKLVLDMEFDFDFATLRSVTHESKKVFFLNYDHDFMYYYRGGYAPQGYYCPLDSWVLKKDIVSLVQSLLDQGYYIVITDNSYKSEFLPLLHYGTGTQHNGYTLLHQ